MTWHELVEHTFPVLLVKHYMARTSHILISSREYGYLTDYESRDATHCGHAVCGVGLGYSNTGIMSLNPT
jgi:hypothetical protein